jgi:predicted dinucleotide-binding enzyme
MENSNPSKVAIIGLGNIGQVVAKNLVNHHRAIIVADRTFEKSQQLATELGTLAKPSSIEEAIKEADIIVLAVWFSAIKSFFNNMNLYFKVKL